MSEKTLEKDAAAKDTAAKDKDAKGAKETHAPVADTTHAHAVAPKRSAVAEPTTPSPQPSSDPEAYWPDDQPHYNEEPPRDQVYPPTDRQANQSQVAVPETYRTPDGYLVTKHPAANAMVNKVEAATHAQESLGDATGHSARSLSQRRGLVDSTVVSSGGGDVEGQMKAKREEIRDLEQRTSDARHELDGMLRQNNFKTV